MSESQFKTALTDYILWFDGVIQVKPEELENYLIRGFDESKLSVTELDKEVEKYNRLAPTKILVKDEIDPYKIDFSWQIPAEYESIDVSQYVLNRLNIQLAKCPSDQHSTRTTRVNRELKEYELRNLFPVLRTLIYIIDEFRKNNIVWGVGRGSSCASYILYLIGVHSVDPVKYDIPLNEFFK